MPKVLISEKIDPICPSTFDQAGVEVDYKADLTPEGLLEIIGDYDALVVRSATKVTAEVLAKGKNLKVVGRAGAGVDNIDVPAATEAGILVMNTPGQNANGVAELVIGLMLSLVRHIAIGSQSIKEGRWEKKNLSGTELLGKSIGLLGYGAIGRRVGVLAQAFGMTIHAYDPFLSAELIQSTGAKALSYEEVIRQSDFVSLHLPMTPDTKNMINADTIATMKKGAILLNCARGGLVDEAALAAALKSGHLAGAALDVFAKEPPEADNPLVPLANFVATPHIGASTAESQVNVASAIARQIADFFQKGTRDGAVNQV